MPSIRQRLADLLVPDAMERLRQNDQLVRRLGEAYVRGPERYRPEDLIRDLRELDPHYLSNLIREINYVQLNVSAPTEADRRRAVYESRYLVRTSPMVEYVIWLWTAFGFGQSVDVVCEDESAADVWAEFWHADRNAVVLGDRRLQDLSNDVLQDGERFLAIYVSKADGKCTVRAIDSLEVTDHITAPGDSSSVVWYKREWVEYNPTTTAETQRVAYYPDFLAFLSGGPRQKVNLREARKGADPDWLGWDADGREVDAGGLLPQGAVRADTAAKGTFVCIVPVCHNTKTDWRGWPLMTTGHAWAREHERFRVNRANVAESKAMVVRELKSDSGSRGIKAVRDMIGSSLSTSSVDEWERNPPPVAGSTFLSNKATQLRDLDMGTGASDAKVDGESLAWYAGLSGRVYPQWFGMGDVTRYATASSMEVPMLRTFNGYQLFWSSVWRDVVRVVLDMAERYGGKAFASTEVQVNLDRILETDTAIQVQNAAAAFTGVLAPLMQAELMPDEALPGVLAGVVQGVLQALGLADVEALFSADMVEKQLAAAEEKRQADAELAKQIAAGQAPGAVPEGEETPPAEEPEGGGNGKEPPTEQAAEAAPSPDEMAAMLAAAQRVLMRG